MFLKIKRIGNSLRKNGITKEFVKKCSITIGILFLIRLGTFIPVPDIDQEYIANNIKNTPIASFVNTFSGGGIFVIGLFTLNIFPYINASILMQVLVSSLPNLEKLQKEGGESGKRKITQITRLISLGWAIVQSISIVLFLKTVSFDWNLTVATQTIICLTTGAMIVLWLSEIITEEGIGNGPSLLIFMNIASNLPNLSQSIFNNSDINIIFLTFLVGSVFIVAISGVIYLQEGVRMIPLVSAKELKKVPSYNRTFNNYVPLRLNQAGVMPIIFTAALLVLPAYLINLNIFPFFKFPFFLKFSKIFYWIAYFSLVITFSSFYSTIVLNPKDISNELRKMAVTIPGIRPGKRTTLFLKQTMKRVTFIGAIFLALLTTIPNILELITNTSSLRGLGTTSLLIIVGVVIDTEREIRSILLTNVYENMKREQNKTKKRKKRKKKKSMINSK
tara:strand:- start:24909 stop:26249 length:1341 start_codon:yes stop_codon:yes gene_type:complete